MLSFLPREFGAESDAPYHDSHPFRTLAWLDFMKEVATIDGPKFVFAHILKPHVPYSFDQYGNITLDYVGWANDHDPTVHSAFYGQVIWFNARMLEVIDAILANYEEPPIMVIAGDHGMNERTTPRLAMTYSRHICSRMAARAPYIRQSPRSIISEQYWTTTSDWTLGCWRIGSTPSGIKSDAYDFEHVRPCLLPMHSGRLIQRLSQPRDGARRSTARDSGRRRARPTTAPQP